MDPQEQAARTARHLYEPVEGVHVAVYVLGEPAAAYRALGLPPGFTGYVAARSGVLGPVLPATAVATFYVFAPALLHGCLPAAWRVASPERVLEARLTGLDDGLRRVLGHLTGSAALEEAAELAGRACAGLRTAGRPLAAGQAAQPVPTAPHLALWHWTTVLREHRGDGHIAALLLADLDPVETLVLHAAVGGPEQFMRDKRGWTAPEWAAGAARLRGRGLIDEAGAATQPGRDLRRRVERSTDEAAAAPWQALGTGGTERLRDLLLPVAAAVRAADLDSGSSRRIGLPRNSTW